MTPVSPRRLLVFLPVAVSLLFGSCRQSPVTIAVIPRTCGTRLWEPFHAGAAIEAHKNGLHIYWNAPTQENDVEKQIGFLSLALERGYRGVVVAPDESLVFRTPVQQFLSRHLPVVIVDDELGLPHDADLSYVLNDEVTGGRLAARRVAARLHGKGAVALLGINPELESITARQHSFEQTLALEAPQIHITIRELGDDPTIPHEQQIAETVLHAFPPVNAIVALSGSATRGAYYAKVESHDTTDVLLVGFDQELLPPISSGEIDAVVIQNAPEIGRLALANIAARLKGESIPETVSVQPVLLTRQNLDSPSTHQMWHDARFPWSEQ